MKDNEHKPFDGELFLEICRRYGVKFSEEYDTIMYEDDDGNIRPLVERDLEEMLSPHQTVVIKTPEEEALWRKRFEESKEADRDSFHPAESRYMVNK